VRYCTQELVFYRDDLLSMMRKHCVAAPADDPSLSDQLVRTLLDQSHLSPLPLSVRPVYWSADHALSLYPLPHVLVVADRQEQFVVEYQGCHCYNPGLFSLDQRFMVYDPSTQTSEWSCLSAAAEDENADEEKDG
jgi:DNA polymerase epsilon subunit 2